MKATQVKPIEGYEGAYEAHSNGTIYSHKRAGRFLKDTFTQDGYAQVVLCTKGTSKRCMVHRLVAQAFLPNPNNLPQVNHLDGVKSNNALSNLEWCDQYRNHAHARELGLIDNRGVKNGSSKLTEAEVIEIRGLHKVGDVTQRALSVKFGISQPVIHKIVNRITWKHVA